MCGEKKTNIRYVIMLIMMMNDGGGGGGNTGGYFVPELSQNARSVCIGENRGNNRWTPVDNL